MSFEEVDFENLDNYPISIEEVAENQTKTINQDSGVVISAKSLEQLTNDENAKWKKINTKLNEFIDDKKDDNKESDFQMKVKKAMELKKKFNDSINNNDTKIKPIFIPLKAIHTPVNGDPSSHIKLQPYDIGNICKLGTVNNENLGISQIPELMKNMIGSFTSDQKIAELFSKYGEKIMNSVKNNPDKYVLNDYSSDNPLSQEIIDELKVNLKETLEENPELGDSMLKLSDEIAEKYFNNPELKDTLRNPEYFQNIFKNIESMTSPKGPFDIESITEPMFGKTVEFKIPVTAELKQKPYIIGIDLPTVSSSPSNLTHTLPLNNNLQPSGHSTFSLFSNNYHPHNFTSTNLFTTPLPNINMQPHTITIPNLNSNSLNSGTITLNNLSSPNNTTIPNYPSFLSQCTNPGIVTLNNLSPPHNITLTPNIHTIPINTSQSSHFEPNPNTHPTMYHFMPELYTVSQPKKSEPQPIKKQKK